MAAVGAPPWRVPLADVVIGEDDLDAVAAAYRSGWLSQGPQARAFEEAIESYTGAPHAIAVSSCTAALHLIALAAGLGPGDEVIVPSLTFVATPTASPTPAPLPSSPMSYRRRSPGSTPTRWRGASRAHQGHLLHAVRGPSRRDARAA